MKVQLAPFWQFIRVNTPDVNDIKFFDFLEINKNARFKSTIYRCLAKKEDKYCNYVSATKMGHEHQGSFEKGNLAVRIETFEGDVYFLDGDASRYVSSYDIYSLKTTLLKEEKGTQIEMTDTVIKSEINQDAIES
jgi:hypothetical protein